MEFLLMLPEPVQLFLLGCGILGLGAGFIMLVTRLWPRDTDSTVILMLQGMLSLAVETVYLEAKERLSELNLEEQREAIKLLAQSTYAMLPEYVILTIRERTIVVPLKALLPQAIFVALCLKAWDTGGLLLEELKKLLEEAYAQWKANDYRFPPSDSLTTTAWRP